MITPVFTVDIGVGIRRSTNDPADNQLIFADQQVRVNVEENGVIWPIPAGATFDLVIVSREDPAGVLLAKSTSSGPVPSPSPTPTGDEEGTIIFHISTNTVELRAHLAGARGKQCIVELVRTDLIVPQTLARWQVVCWNQGFNPAAAVYAQLKHNTTCNPDAAPTINDDSLLGYAIGSVWVHCAANAVYMCLDATPGAAEWRQFFLAEDEFYDNTFSGLVANNVQDAIDEVQTGSGTGVQPWPVPAVHLGLSVPTTTTRLPMADTSDMRVGQGVQVEQLGSYTYHLVTAVGANYIDLCGPPLTIGTLVDRLWIVPGAPVVEFIQIAQNVWDGSVQALLLNIEHAYDLWEGETAHLVTFSAVQFDENGVSQGKVNVYLDGSPASTNDGAKGVQLSTSGVWVANPDDAISRANYTVGRNSVIELWCTEAGVTGIGRFLTVRLTFV
jgi:hypothetical protein